MRERDWQLGGVVFGSRESGIVHATAPDLGDVEVRVDDADRPRGDGRLFGQDYRGAWTITFDLTVVADSEDQARAAAAGLGRVWRGDTVRGTPGTVAALGNGDRVLFGRPRRWAQVDTHATKGVIGVVADFACVDDLARDAVEQVVTVSIPAATVGGGLVTPLVTPLTTLAGSSRKTVAVIGGDTPAHPVIEITGPITTPKLTIAGWTQTWDLTIPAGKTLTIDTRPWRRTATLTGGGSVAGDLAPGSRRIADALLPPGQAEVVLAGIDNTGTATLRMRWRDTYTSL